MISSYDVILDYQISKNIIDFILKFGINDLSILNLLISFQ